jgi:hypothetical protein
MRQKKYLALYWTSQPSTWYDSKRQLSAII